MFTGYLLLSVPTKYGTGLGLIYAALGVICLGTGLFKGNLQALVGNLYDDPKFSSKRDSAFNIFYMCINIGSMFAPTAGEAVINFVLKKLTILYGRIPALAHKFLRNETIDVNNYLALAQVQDNSVTMNTLHEFSENYVNTLSTSYHYGFVLACVSLVISLIIFITFRKHYKHADFTEKQKIKANNNTILLLN